MMSVCVTPELLACLSGMWLCDWWIYGKSIGHHRGDSFGGGCLFFSSLWGLGVFGALPTNQSLLWAIPHLSFHTCHSTLVTLLVRVSFLSMPWQEVRRVSFSRCFSCWLPGEQWSFCVSVCSSPPTAQSLSVILEVGLLYAQLCTGVHIQGATKKCVLHIRPRSARPGDYCSPENPSLNWERKMSVQLMQRSSATGQRVVGHMKAFKRGLLRGHKKNWTT